MSNFETASGIRLGRDCGYSAALPNDPTRSLWLFCDTTYYNAAGTGIMFAYGTFGAVTSVEPGLVPTNLNELPTPPTPVPSLPTTAAPGRFLTNPVGYTHTADTACTYQARWANGLTRGPQGSVTMRNGTTPVTIPNASQRLFVTFADVCVVVDEAAPLGLDMELKAVGVAAYNPATNALEAESAVHAVSDPAAELSWQRQMFHPVFQGGHMYTYASHCSSDAYELYGLCLDGRVTVGRVPVSSLSTSSSYRYWTSGAWSTSPTAATDVLPAGVPGAYGPVLVDVHDLTAYGKGYVMMEQNGYGGHYRLWQASSPGGPWTSLRAGVMHGCPAGAGGGCYHFWAHPELESGGQWLYSIYDMQSGRVELSSVGTIPGLP